MRTVVGVYPERRRLSAWETMTDTDLKPQLRPAPGSEIVPVGATDGEIVPVEERPAELVVAD
ncbi:hypothetical protein ACFQL1_15630 [Halomicroarcula sp. GCM10025709]|uniref:hypothetical protein n=1 Tax=Halomicroarcula sp. GCM10025709 TaxID=3252669 RepID=UPI0036137DCE